MKAMLISLNQDIAGRLDEVSRILAEQGANRFRVQAYQRAASAVRELSCPVSEIFDKEGINGLEKIPGVGETIARSIRDILLHGKLAMLERLRGEHDPLALLQSVPGIGKVTAWRLYEDLGIESLEELEAAAHDGRLEKFAGIGDKRIAGIRDTLGQRLGRIRQKPTGPRSAQRSHRCRVARSRPAVPRGGCDGRPTENRAAPLQPRSRRWKIHRLHRFKRLEVRPCTKPSHRKIGNQS